MKIELYKGNEQIDIEKINEIEAKLEVEFPVEYVKFLLNQNGGNPKKSRFKLPDGSNQSLVNIFYPIGEEKGNLQRINRILYGTIPEGYISIADDPGGNEILLRVKGENIGEIYFWDHDIDPKEDNNMHFLANSLNEFLNMLK